jgi:hypothetical protein
MVNNTKTMKKCANLIEMHELQSLPQLRVSTGPNLSSPFEAKIDIIVTLPYE